MIFSKTPNKPVITPEVAILVQGIRSEKAFAVTKTGDVNMSGKILARVSALSLAVFLAACGGDENSAPIVNVSSDNPTNPGTDTGQQDGGDSTDGSSSTPVTIGIGNGSSFISGQVQASAKTLSSGGTALLEVSAVDASNSNKLITGEELSISFTSSCIDSGKAQLSANPVTVSSGVARTTYTAAGCSGQDLVTATSGSSEASVVLDIETAVPVTFIALTPSHTSIAPTNISGNSQEGRPASSTVQFQLIDKDENGVEGVSVAFEIFPAGSASVLSADSEPQTGADGLVSAVVEAGSRHEVVRVVATATTPEGKIISTTSAPVAVNSYIPEDSNFSISIDNFLPNAMGIDGVQVGVSVNAADRYGNAIRGNTIINFTTSNGAITPDCELDGNGSCSVTWRSLNTREARPRITAYTQGEKYLSGTDCDLPDSSCDYEFATLLQSTRIVQSSSDEVKVSLSNAGGTTYCASTFVNVFDQETGSQQVVPPSGTTVDFEVTDGTIVNESQASKTIGTGSKYVYDIEYQACIDVVPDAAPANPPTLKVIVTPPNGDPAEDYLLL